MIQFILLSLVTWCYASATPSSSSTLDPTIIQGSVHDGLLVGNPQIIMCGRGGFVALNGKTYRPKDCLVYRSTLYNDTTSTFNLEPWAIGSPVEESQLMYMANAFVDLALNGTTNNVPLFVFKYNNAQASHCNCLNVSNMKYYVYDPLKKRTDELVEKFNHTLHNGSLSTY